MPILIFWHGFISNLVALAHYNEDKFHVFLRKNYKFYVTDSLVKSICFLAKLMLVGLDVVVIS